MLCHMARAPWVPLVAMLVLGCTDVGGGEDTNPFGDGTAASGTGTGEPNPPTGGEASTAASGEATAEPTTATPTTDAPTTDAPTTGPPPGTDDATTAPEDTSGGSGEVELGECIGIGAWESCAQYCEAVLEVCVEAGCDGATVVYYGDVASCNAMQGNGGEATACDEGFAMGGGASFARCCCQ